MSPRSLQFQFLPRCFEIFLCLSFTWTSFPTSGLAQSSLYCDQPYLAICGSNGEGATQREEQIESLLRSVREKALVETANEAGLDGIFEGESLNFQTLKKIRNLKSYGKTPTEKAAFRKKKTRIMRLYFEKLADEIRILLTRLAAEKGLSQLDLMEQFQFARIVEMLRSSVQNSQLDPAAKKFVKQRLRQLELVSVWDLLQKESQTTNQSLYNNYIGSCGYSGLSDNDFALEFYTGSNFRKTGTKRFVIVPCLSAVIAALNPIYAKVSRAELVLATQVWTMGHEMGHHFDATSTSRRFQGKKVYRGLYQCLQKETQKILLPDPAEEKRLGRKQTQAEIVESHIGEISADHWGNEVLADYLSTISDREARFSILKENLFGLCSDSDEPTDSDDGIHPSAHFRIQMARANSRLSMALGCIPPPPQMCSPK